MDAEHLHQHSPLQSSEEHSEQNQFDKEAFEKEA